MIDLLTKGGVRDYVYPVGRLDYESEGLLLLTSDGDLAAKLTHPRHGVAREYEAKVLGVPDEHELERLARGIVIDGRKTAPAEIKLLKVTEGSGRQHALLSIVDPRRPQPPGAQDVRGGRPSGRPAQARAHRPDHRRAHPAGGVPRARRAGSRRAEEGRGRRGDGETAAAATREPGRRRWPSGRTANVRADLKVGAASV